MNEIPHWDERDFESLLPWLEHSDWGNWIAIFDYALNEKNLDFCRRCIRGAKQRANTPEAQAWVRYTEARLFMEEGDLERAEKGLLRAQSDLSEREEKVHFDVLEDLGRLYRTTGRYEKAIKIHEQQLIAAEKWGDADAIGGVHHNFGASYLDVGDTKRAESHLILALQHLQDSENAHQTAFAEMSLGALYYETHRLDEAETTLLKALNRIAHPQTVDDFSLIAFIKSTLGDVLIAQKKLLEAEKIYLDAKLILEEMKAKTVDFIPLYTALGNIAFYREDWDKAQFWFEESIALAREWGFQTGLRDALENLAIVLQKKAEHNEVISIYDEAISIAKSQGNVDATKRLQRKKLAFKVGKVLKSPLSDN